MDAPSRRRGNRPHVDRAVFDDRETRDAYRITDGDGPGNADSD